MATLEEFQGVTDFLNSLRPCALATLRCILDFTSDIENAQLQRLRLGTEGSPAFRRFTLHLARSVQIPAAFGLREPDPFRS